MPLDFTPEVPQSLRQNTNIMSMVRTFARLFDQYVQDMSGLPDLWMNPKLIPLRLLPLKFADFGWSLNGLELTEDQKRKLISLIPFVYREKGTIPGIINLIRLLLNIEVTAVIETSNNQPFWVVGVSEVGVDTIVGIEDPSSFLLISTTQNLTPQDVLNILFVANLMRVAGTQIVLTYPNQPSFEDTYLRVGDEFGDKEIFNGFDRVHWRNRPEVGTTRPTFNE